MTDPITAISSAVEALAVAAPAFALAVRPHPAVAMARAERAQGLTRRRAAHHRGRLVEAREGLRREIGRRAEGRVRDRMEARLAGVVEELADLTRT